MSCSPPGVYSTLAYPPSPELSLVPNCHVVQYVIIKWPFPSSFSRHGSWGCAHSLVIEREWNVAVSVVVVVAVGGSSGGGGGSSGGGGGGGSGWQWVVVVV